LPRDGDPIKLNGAIHVTCTILKLVAASAAEAEQGALFLNTQEAKVIRLVLAELGHPQPPTPIHIDNTTTVGIVNNTIKRQHLDARRRLLLALARRRLLLALARRRMPAAKSSSTRKPLLAGTSGLRVEELLAAGILLLASASGLFLDETEAMVLVRPQFIDGPLPIPVCAVRAGASTKKNGPPEWCRRQQSGSLLVFADGSLKPIFFATRSTKGVRGGGGCSVRSSRTTTWGRVGGAATT
jgi:hypothetical protein